MQDNNSLIRQYGAQYGLILGLILLAVNIISIYYIGDVAVSMVNIILSIFSTGLVIKLGLAITFVVLLRTKLGGYWNLKQAATASFFMFYMAFLITYIGNDIIFARLIDPVTVQRANDKTIDAYQQAQLLNKTPKKEVDARVKEMRDSFNDANHITPGSVLEYLLSRVIFIFLAAIIFAALFKREPPLFTQGGEPYQ